MRPDAKKAIHVLRNILENLDPAYVPYFAAPNTILTLSGARAFCDGVFWDSPENKHLESWLKDIENSLEVIKSDTRVLYSNTKILKNPGAEKYTYYELITEEGFRLVLSRTKLLKNYVIKNKYTDTSQIMKDLVHNLKSQEKYSNYSAQNLEHVAFGILLGYPDSAITETVALWHIDDPFAEPLIDADIRGAKYYRCPQPIYSYPRKLIGNTQIIKHEREWSKILKDYYTSEFHKTLEKNQRFLDKIKEIS